MNSELKILKKIWENNGKNYVQLLSSQMGLGTDYTRYICNYLFKKEEIRLVKGKSDWYRITSKGKKELELRGIIKIKISKKVQKKLRLKKTSNYLSQKAKLKASSKSKKPQKVSNIKKVAKIKRVKSNFDLIEAKEKKLNLGKSITKAVSFLRGQLLKKSAR